MTQVQEFIKENGIDALNEFNIKIKHYPERKLYVLNYDQIDSPKSHPFVIECRSLIIGEDLSLISRTFDRFFNYGESPEHYKDFDINRAIVMEKADGSLTKIYWEPNAQQWEIGTRSLAFAEGEHQMGGTWRDKIIAALGISNETDFQSFFNTTNKDITFIFEYISPENRIVTRYEKAEMVFIGARDKHTQLSWDDMNQWAEFFSKAKLNIRLPQIYPLKNFEDIVIASKELPTLTEGYVVWDIVSNKRVKIKNPSYVAIHGLRDNGILSMKKVYSLVLMNEQDEYLTYYPEDAPVFEPAIEAVRKMKKHMQDVWNGHVRGFIRFGSEEQENEFMAKNPPLSQIKDQKEFALKATQFKFSAFLFLAKKKGTNPLHEFENAEIIKKLRFFIANNSDDETSTE